MGKRRDHVPPSQPAPGSVAAKLAEARKEREARIAKAEAIGRKK